MIAPTSAKCVYRTQSATKLAGTFKELKSCWDLVTPHNVLDTPAVANRR